jgi:hypothetical protein
MEGILSGIEHVSQQDTSAGLVDGDGERLGLGLRSGHLGSVIGSGIGSGFICSGELPHQCISAVVVEIHTGYVCII